MAESGLVERGDAQQGEEWVAKCCAVGVDTLPQEQEVVHGLRGTALYQGQKMLLYQSL